LKLGYHPWFTHRYTLLDPPPSKSDHYHSIFFSGKKPNPKNLAILEMLLPYLPDPLPFGPMLGSLAEDIERSKAEGRVVMLGEIGLDGGARMRWPPSARHLYEEKYPASGQEEEEWNRLTPFKVSMAHQRGIAEAQMGVAVEQGVSISFHSVAAPGMSFLPNPSSIFYPMTDEEVQRWKPSKLSGRNTIGVSPRLTSIYTQQEVGHLNSGNKPKYVPLQ
jgi:Tat protein secretion system quality control protein TatD with DNase activity